MNAPGSGPRDTDGDGDCDLCARDGGCARRKFAAEVSRIVGAQTLELRPLGDTAPAWRGRISVSVASEADGLLVLPPIEFNPDSLMILKRSHLSPVTSAPLPLAEGPASVGEAVWIVSEQMELRTWRLLGADLMPLLERCLAASVEPPDPALLRLQHSLAELLRLPANK